MAVTKAGRTTPRSTWRALAAAAAVWVVTGWLWNQVRESEMQAARHQAQDAAREFSTRSMASLENQTEALVRMGARWDEQPSSRSSWESDAKLYIEHSDGLLTSLELHDPDRGVAWAMARDGDGRAIGRVPSASARTPALQAPRIDPIRPLASGALGSRAWIPLGQRAEGHLVATFDLSALFRPMRGVEKRHRLQLRDDDAAETAEDTSTSGLHAEAQAAIGQARWSVMAMPNYAVHGPASWWLLAGGTLLSLTLGLLVWNWGVAKTQAEQLSAVIDLAPVGILMVDAQGDIVRANGASHALFGYRGEPGGLLGTNVDALVPEAHRARHVADRQRFGRTGTPRRMGSGTARTITGIRKDAKPLSLEIGLTPLDLPSGPHVLAVVLDVTERDRSARDLRAHAEALVRSNTELEQFAYVASHDLQEPLRTIASYAEIIAETYAEQLDNDGRFYLDNLVLGAHRMQRLIKDLLALARLPSDPQCTHVQVDEVVTEALANLGASGPGEEGPVVRCGELPVLETDRSQLVRVFENLLDNAIKFNRESRAEIDVTSEASAGGWVFHIRDNGIGFDMQQADRIFRIFQRLHHRDVYGGTGTGLAVVKKLVEQRGGAVWAESNPGAGATFSFSWPTGRTQDATAITAANVA